MRLAFIAPFYGERAAGGAEAECHRTIQHLLVAGHEIEVFTTNLLDLNHDWSVSWHALGSRREQGVLVHRFATHPVYPEVLGRLNQALQEGVGLNATEETMFAAQHVSSSDLLQALYKREQDFDAFCFIPYCYGTTIFGAQLFPEKTILIPCLHNEGYARLSMMKSVFLKAARVVFHSRAEQTLAEKLYGNRPEAYRLIGEGVDLDFKSNAERFRAKYEVSGSFALCVGRKDESKNTPQLVRWFERYVQQQPDGAQLIFVGPGSVHIPAGRSDRIRDLGFVSVQDKRDALAAAAVLVNPSLNESFSLVLMEAWACGTPAIVHANCAVTREHVCRASGGLYACDSDSFSRKLDWLLLHPEEAGKLGASGQHYANSNFAWPVIRQAWEQQILNF